jgi:hypothetical protein
LTAKDVVAARRSRSLEHLADDAYVGWTDEAPLSLSSPLNCVRASFFFMSPALVLTLRAIRSVRAPCFTRQSSRTRSMNAYAAAGETVIVAKSVLAFAILEE